MKDIIMRTTDVVVDNDYVQKYELFDEEGQSVTILSYGCTIQSIKLKDKNGQLVDIALGYDTVDEYIKNGGYFGATVGRCANRIANGRFILNGKVYQIPLNDGENTLHGGFNGFDKKNWECSIDEDRLVARRVSPDGEEGYPGNLTVVQKISFSEGVLRLRYKYQSDMDTVVNLTNHCYFNLNGAGNGDILRHRVTIGAEGYCEVDEGLIPTKLPKPVDGTPFDFRSAKEIGRDIENKDAQIALAGSGYDHNFALDNRYGVAVEAVGDETGIRLRQFTDYPGVQFYTGNMIGPEPVKGKKGGTYKKYSGFCIEAQQFPNAINVPDYPSAVAKANQGNEHYIEFRFDLE